MKFKGFVNVTCIYAVEEFTYNLTFTTLDLVNLDKILFEKIPQTARVYYISIIDAEVDSNEN